MNILIFFILPSIESPIDFDTIYLKGPFSLIESMDLNPNFFTIFGRDFKDSAKKVIPVHGEIFYHFTFLNREFALEIWGEKINHLYGSAYAFFISNSFKRAALEVSGCYVEHNGKPVYSSENNAKIDTVPIILNKGRNDFVIRYPVYDGDANFHIRIIPVSLPLKLVDRIVKPILKYDDKSSFYIGVPIFNTTGKFINRGYIQVDGNNFFSERIKIPRLIPLGITYIPLKVYQKESENSSNKINIILTYRGLADTMSTSIKIVDETQPIRSTYISPLDSSVQTYSLWLPNNFSDSLTYSLLFVLHEAGVDEYKYIFKYPRADSFILISPSTRNDIFNWQGIGSFNIFDVLDLVKQRFRIDEKCISITGHSMGGHGALINGLMRPDIFSNIVAFSPWITHKLYDVNVFSNINSFLYNTLDYIENAKYTKLILFHGKMDLDVPVFHSRILTKMSLLKGISVKYIETNSNHWDDSPLTSWKDYLWNDSLYKQLKEKPKSNTTNIYFKSPYYYKNIKDVFMVVKKEPLILSYLSIKTSKDTLRINTRNIVRLGIFLQNPIKYVRYKNRTFKKNLSDSIIIEIAGNNCKFSNPKKYFFKHDGFSGPVKNIFQKEFIIVYGNYPDSTLTFYEAKFLSWWWWYYGNGFTRVFSENEITIDDIKYKNIIFIGNGISDFYKNILKKLPVKLTSKKLVLNKLNLEGQYGLIEIFPYSKKSLVLFISGNSMLLQKKVFSLFLQHKNELSFDFMVLDKNFKILKKDFFNANWEFRR